MTTTFMARKNEPFLIADTSGLVSLTVTTDRNHKQALEATVPLQEQQTSILVPFEVLVETVNVLGRQIGHDQALAVASYVYATPLFHIFDSSPIARTQAFQLFRKLPQAVSLTDCIVMAVADEFAWFVRRRATETTFQEARPRGPATPRRGDAAAVDRPGHCAHHARAAWPLLPRGPVGARATP